MEHKKFKEEKRESKKKKIKPHIRKNKIQNAIPPGTLLSSESRWGRKGSQQPGEWMACFPPKRLAAGHQ